jgi:hypothetical protein
MFIAVDVFQPFRSRQGIDTVVGLRCVYDPGFVEEIKRSLRSAGRWLKLKNPGGWLAEHRVWFVEWAAWPFVRDDLRRAGFEFGGEPLTEADPCVSGANRKAPPPNPPGAREGCPACQKLPAALEEWAWEMRVRWSDDALPAIEAGHALLWEMLLGERVDR